MSFYAFRKCGLQYVVICCIMLQVNFCYLLLYVAQSSKMLFKVFKRVSFVMCCCYMFLVNCCDMLLTLVNCCFMLLEKYCLQLVPKHC